jgi:hypothetical protein
MMTIRWRSHTVEISIWNPVYALAPLVLLSISLPLAIAAFITTSFAFFLLFFRALFVAIELIIALVSAWINSEPPKKAPALYRSPTLSSPEQLSPTRRRHLHSNNGSSLSSQERTMPSTKPGRLDISSGMFMTSFSTNNAPRDYEGVGGWRTRGNDDEEALWMGMNSRLQLPGDMPARRHQRSQSGGNTPVQRQSWSPEASRTNLLHNKAKTPVRFALDEYGDYFPPQPTTSMRRSSDAPKPSKSHERRKSVSSTSSSGLMMAEKGAEG